MKKRKNWVAILQTFISDPIYVDTKIVKRIGIDAATNSISVEINSYLILQTIHLENFAEETIRPLKKQITEILQVKQKPKQAIINSVVTCINRNVYIIKNSQLTAPGLDNDKESTYAKILVDLASRSENTELFFKDQYGVPYALC